MGLTLGVTFEKELEEVRTKNIIVGSYLPSCSLDTGTNIGGANCSAFVTKQRLRMPRGRTGVLKGFIVPNTGGTSTIGEGAATSAKNFKGSCFIQRVEQTAYPLYAAQDASDRTLVLAANEFSALFIKGAIALEPSDEVWVQLSVSSSAAGDGFSRNYILDTTAGEGCEFYTNASAATNETNAQTAADSFLQPTNAGNHISEFTTHVEIMGVAGMIVEVPANARHFAIVGTSRQRGKPNYFNDPRVKLDGAIQMLLDDLGHTYVDLSKGGEFFHLGWADSASVFRRSMFEGVSDVVFGHTVNMMTSNTSIAEWQQLVRNFTRYHREAKRRVIGLPEPPYVDLGGGGGVEGDPTTAATFSAVDADATTKLSAIYTWMTGSMEATCVGGDPTIKLRDLFDEVWDIVAPITQTGGTQWAEPTSVLATTVSAADATSLTVASGTFSLYSTYDYFIKTLTSADAVTYAYAKGNTTTTKLTVASWNNGTPGAGKAVTIYKCVTKDGLHPSLYGKQLQRDALYTRLAPYFGGTYSAASFDPVFDIPKCVDVWTPKSGYNFTDASRTALATAQADAVRQVVGQKRRVIGVQATAGNKPTINIVSSNKRWAYDSDAYFDFITGGALWLTNQNAWCLTVAMKWPSSWAAVGIFFRASLAAGNWAQFYTETSTNTLAISTRRTTSTASAVADTGTFAGTAGDVVILSFVVDWMNGRHEVWATAPGGTTTLAVFDTVAWSDGSGKSGVTPTAMNFGHSATSANTDVLGYAAHQCAPSPGEIANLHTWLRAEVAATG